MCFSATASCTAGTVLTAAGGLTVHNRQRARTQDLDDRVSSVVSRTSFPGFARMVPGVLGAMLDRGHLPEDGR